MTPEGRFAFDTNVLLSALFFPKSKPGEAFQAASQLGKIVLSLATFGELAEVLSRPKFDRYVRREERERFLAAFLREAELVEIEEPIQASRDPQDDKFLELAVAGSVQALISGDDDLVSLHPFRNIPILTPAAFLRLLQGSETSP